MPYETIRPENDDQAGMEEIQSPEASDQSREDLLRERKRLQTDLTVLRGWVDPMLEKEASHLGKFERAVVGGLSPLFNVIDKVIGREGPTYDQMLQGYKEEIQQLEEKLSALDAKLGKTAP